MVVRWRTFPAMIIRSGCQLYYMDKEEKEMLADLAWLQAVIATELIQVTENTSSLLHGSPPPRACIEEHRRLRQHALEIAERYRPGSGLKEHLAGHA